MELVVPSLVALLVGIAIAFFILPRLAPTILIGGSVVVLGLAIYLHYSRFGRMEYEVATWQHNLKQYGSWIMVAAVFVGAYGFYIMNSASASSAPVAAANTSEMPPLSMPQMGGGFKNVANTVSSRLTSLMRHGRINV